ncbi:CHAP domain-containing protein [Actinoallomurus iriomotensis]|uniref:Peptidase C51 domain-containing protein n=1 Tax=Actinoallomurus iriomotensis TaxID=478107 RepID=A0A9W6RUK0_9ACTN|nr:CHAP domain-containing protein [Actinoallomurus iriomotensis]GLY81824.1 hypothetical protein Airi01_100910 [Actinoallomurus iriomotensis]
MPGATAQIKAARALLGTSEHPPGSNHNNITVWYNAHIARIGDGAWCDMSVTKEAYDSGNEVAVVGGAGKGFAYVPAHAAWFKSKGRFHTGTSGIRAGDVVFFNWSRKKGTTSCDHVGLVEKVFSDGTFYSLEGNTSDAFRRQHRDSTYVSGYGRPAYSATSKEDPLIGLKKGDKGEAVTGLQVLLTYAGQEKVLGKVDGEYGTSTAEALRLARQSVGSEAKAGYGDKVTGWAYAQLMCAVARQQGHA